MAKNTGIKVEGAGTSFQVITRSSPAIVIILFYIAFSFFSLWIGDIVLWMIISGVIITIFLVLLILKPERLWTESHSLDMKKLDLSYLGDKKNPQVKSEDYAQFFQPIPNKSKTKSKGKK